jgi:hypothetical protein
VTFRPRGFYADYNDVQIPGSVGAVVGGIPTFVGVTTNAARRAFMGVEFEGNAILARDFGAEATAQFRLVARLSQRGLSGYFAAIAIRDGVTTLQTSPISARCRTRRMDGERHAELRVPWHRGRLNVMSTLVLPQQLAAVRAAVRRARPGRLHLWDANLVWHSDNDRWRSASRPQPDQQALHRLGLQFPVARTGAPNVTQRFSGVRAISPPAANPGLNIDARRRGRARPLITATPRQVFLIDRAELPLMRGREQDRRGGPGGRVLLILLLAYIFNFIDRQIIGVLAVPIKAELRSATSSSG